MMNASGRYDRQSSECVFSQPSTPESDYEDANNSPPFWCARTAQRYAIDSNLMPARKTSLTDDKTTQRRSVFCSSSDVDSGVESLSSIGSDVAYDLLTEMPYAMVPDEGFPDGESQSDEISLEHYLCKKSLRKGMFGEVYLVEQAASSKSPNRRYVLKVARGEDGSKEWIRNNKKLVHEYEMLQLLGSHPNIVRCFGLQVVDGKKGLLLELIEGSHLYKITDCLCEMYRKKELSYEEFVAVIVFIEQQKLEAFFYLEKHGVVHGDLNQGNFLYDKKTGRIKLIDFGQAACQGNKMVCGHEDFTPPEAIDSLQGSRYAVPAKCSIDSYALGHMQYKIYHDVVCNGGHSFAKRFNENEFAIGQRGEKALNIRRILKEYTKLNSDGSHKSAISEMPEACVMNNLSEKGNFNDFDTLYDRAIAVKAPWRQHADYTNQLMHPDPDLRKKASEMKSHPWVYAKKIDKQWAMEMIERAINHWNDLSSVD